MHIPLSPLVIPQSRHWMCHFLPLCSMGGRFYTCSLQCFKFYKASRQTKVAATLWAFDFRRFYRKIFRPQLLHRLACTTFEFIMFFLGDIDRYIYRRCCCVLSFTKPVQRLYNVLQSVQLYTKSLQSTKPVTKLDDSKFFHSLHSFRKVI